MYLLCSSSCLSYWQDINPLLVHDSALALMDYVTGASDTLFTWEKGEEDVFWKAVNVSIENETNDFFIMRVEQLNAHSARQKCHSSPGSSVG